MQIDPQHPIAYFCAEYGFDSNLPLYAGGLGVLAGDTLKAAADMQLPMAAIGILYRGNESMQVITPDGEQVELKHDFDPLSQGLEHVYVDDMPLFVKVHLTTADIWVRCWKKQFSETVTLYLLDTDTDQNPLSERSLTHALYYGSDEELIRQQMILGIGGVKLLHALNIHPSLYQLNEGRPAFLHWQLIRAHMEGHGMSYEEAKQEAIHKTVYTNHTLVAAGNQSYSIHPIKTYAQYYAEKIGIDLDILLSDGIEKDPERFVMTRFALNVSRKAQAVSQIHGNFCKEAWPEYNWTAVTNGVHMPTWQDERFRQDDMSDEHLWNTHADNKQKLVEYVAEKTGFGYDPNRLVIAWARRIAGYKQLEQLFTDIERLRHILRNKQMPVQLLIAGKAHFGDKHGKSLIKQVIDHMSRELSGHAIFVPNYNLEEARMLVSGSDLWVNTPIFGQEACGTSGMKAVSNGVLQLSVADGWMAEVDINSVGWVLDHNDLSNSFYSLMEEFIVPLYYQRDGQNIPRAWVARMRSAIELAKRYSAERMLNEYKEKLYS